MQEEYLDRRRHFRTSCDLSARCKVGADRRVRTIRLTDINETGLALSADAQEPPFERGATITLWMPSISGRTSFDFEIKWVRMSDDAVQAGAKVAPASARDYARLVETIRHIQCWREVEQHLKKKPISMSSAIRSWRRRHS